MGMRFTEERAGNPTSQHQGAEVQHELEFISGNSLPSAGGHKHDKEFVLFFFRCFSSIYKKNILNDKNLFEII